MDSDDIKAGKPTKADRKADKEAKTTAKTAAIKILESSKEHLLGGNLFNSADGKVAAKHTLIFTAQDKADIKAAKTIKELENLVDKIRKGTTNYNNRVSEAIKK